MFLKILYINTNGFTYGTKSSVFHRELQQNYHPYHYHRQNISVGVYNYDYQRTIFVSIRQGVQKYLPSMSQSPTDRLSVITVANTDGIIPLIKFSQEIFFLRHASPSVIPSVF